MAYNGSGTFLINTAGQPVVAGTVISSTTFNSLTADLATGLSTVITKDGQTTVTANIPMASFKFTGLGVGSAAGDSANLSQVQSTVTKLLTSVSGADTITAVGAPVVAAYVAGQMFYFVATGDNTTSVTINIDGLGAKAVTRDGSVALVAGDIKSGEVVVVVYDGTRFQVVSQLNSAGNATFANVSITSALNVGGVATFAAGSAAAPSITTTGDTNTGIFFPAADSIGFSEGGVEAARFNSSGFLGIGTASPAFRLHVSGSSSQFALISTTDTTSTTGVLFGDSASDTVGRIEYVHSDNGMRFYTNGTTQATLDSSGNLGLGVTPSASSVKTFEITAAGNTLTGLGGGDIALMSNAYYNSGFKYAGSNLATSYRQQDGVHKWNIAATGTAGNAISFTQAMTLDASGNLGIGTTTPSTFGKLAILSTGTSTTVALVNSSSSSASNTVSTDYFLPNSFGGLEKSATIGAINPNAGGNNGGALYFSTSSNGTATTPTERARITAAGDFLVGGTTQVGGGSGASISTASRSSSCMLGLQAANGSGYNSVIYFECPGSNAGTISYMRNNDRFEVIAGGSGGVSLASGGTSWVSLSDERNKDIIEPIANAVNKVATLRAVIGKYKTDANDKRRPFLIAQDVQAVLPEAVEEAKDDGTLGLSYSDVIPLLVAAIKELSAKVAALESK